MGEPLTKVVTPVGELNYVQISGKGKKNYNEDGFNYVATVSLTGDDAEELKGKIDEVLGAVPKGKTIKSVGYRKVYKDAEGKKFSPTSNRKVTDTDTETDETAFTFTTATTFGEGKPKKIGVFNSKAQKVSLGEKKVGNGSIGCISGAMQRFERGKEVGVSLFLNAIQLTKFIPYDDDAGFGEQEGDFDGVEDNDFVGDVDTDTDSGSEEATEKKAASKPRL